MSSKPLTPVHLKPAIDRLVRLTSTRDGLDASLMLVQYSSPFVIALLLRLAKFRADHPRVPFPGSMGAGGDAGVKSLIRVAQGWGKVGGSIGEARVIMRGLGLIPIIQWLLSLYPDPSRSVLQMLKAPHKIDWSSDKTLPTLQALSLLCYYPLEHLTWLASKGVFALSPAAVKRSSLWACRFWALYVVLTMQKLRISYSALHKRTQALKSSRQSTLTSKAEGYELQDSASETSVPPPMNSSSSRNEEVEALKADWAAWKTGLMINCAYLPLTVHWSVDGGLWSTSYLTAAFGTIAAVGQLVTQWRRASN